MLLMANFYQNGKFDEPFFLVSETAQNGSITRLVKPLGQWVLATNPTI